MPIGIPISALVREMFIEYGAPFGVAVVLSERFDARVKTGQWVELLDGTTFDRAKHEWDDMDLEI